MSPFKKSLCEVIGAALGAGAGAAFAGYVVALCAAAWFGLAETDPPSFFPHQIASGQAAVATVTTLGGLLLSLAVKYWIRDR